MSRPRDHRPHRPGPHDKTVEIPLRPGKGAEPASTDEPWWKNVNQRPAPPPRTPAPRPSPRPAPPPPPRPGGTAHRPEARPRPSGQRPSQPARSHRAQPKPGRRRGAQLYALSAVGAVAISAGALGLWIGLSKFGVLQGKVLDVSKAEAGVQRILVDPVEGYGATSVSDVVCNGGEDPVVKKGATFTCEVIVDGRKRQVLVLFQDDNGTYEVDRPR